MRPTRNVLSAKVRKRVIETLADRLSRDVDKYLWFVEAHNQSPE